MKKAFTLIELLVVIAIIAILAAILFPVFAQAKAAAKKTACLAQAKQVGLANAMYTTDFDGTMVPFCRAEYGDNVWSPSWGGYYGLSYWYVNFLPYIKSYDLIVCPEKDYDYSGYAAFIDGKAPDPGNKDGGSDDSGPYAGRWRMTWCWNAIAKNDAGDSVWDYADKADATFNPSGKTGFSAEFRDYWNASPISESSVEDTSGTIWLAEGAYPDLGRFTDTDRGFKLQNEGTDDYYHTTQSGKRLPGVHVRPRHNGSFNAIFGDSHAKSRKYASTKPSEWSIQQD